MLAELLWWTAVTLALRSVFEPVMVAYYLWPPLAVALVAAARDWSRLVPTGCVTVVLTFFSQIQWRNPWIWWTPMVIGLALALYFARIRTRPSRPVVAGAARAGGADPHPSPQLTTNPPRQLQECTMSRDIAAIFADIDAFDPDKFVAHLTPDAKFRFANAGTERTTPCHHRHLLLPQYRRELTSSCDCASPRTCPGNSRATSSPLARGRGGRF